MKIAMQHGNVSAASWPPSTNRGGLSWPKLGQLTGIPYGTAHGLARPFIPRDDD